MNITTYKHVIWIDVAISWRNTALANSIVILEESTIFNVATSSYFDFEWRLEINMILYLVQETLKGQMQIICVFNCLVTVL